METIMTSREFNQDRARAKRAARKGPVFITDRGKKTFVLMSMDEYQERLTDDRSIVDLLSGPPGVGDIDFDPPRSRELPRPVDLD